MSMPEDYRGKFIAQLHNALSGFTGTDVDEAVRSDCHKIGVVKGMTPHSIDIRSRVNQKPLASRLKQDQITVFDLI